MGTYYIKKKNDRFIVIKSGAKRASKSFSTYIEAANYADTLRKEGAIIKDQVVLSNKHIKKAFKKAPLITTIILIAFVILFVVYVLPNLNFSTKTNSLNSSKTTQKKNPGVVYEDFQIHFLELGNWYTGDSIYLKILDYDILIDAGSKESSATTLTDYIDDYCTDKKLEYVIATHAHMDHIGGFISTASSVGIFDYYDIDTLIDFPRSDSTSQIYSSYLEKREELVADGMKHYTALDCTKEQNGATKVINFSSDIKMEVLYQKYYEEKASTENNYSVCVIFHYFDHHYLFTGDLEAIGENSLLDYNDLPTCDLYKAGHHGSKTSSSAALLAQIKPKVVCVCCCAGSDQYTDEKNNQFPCQDFINRIKPYTDEIYITSLSIDNDSKIFQAMNGNIIFSSNGTTFSVACSNNNMILKDTEWFKENRVWE